MNYDEIIQSALKEVEDSNASEKLEQVRIKYFGKNGTFTNALKSLSTLSIEEKKSVGQKLNGFKNLFFSSFSRKKNQIENLEINKKLENDFIDLSLPAREVNFIEAKVHPISHTTNEIVNILGDMGLSYEEGPDIEDDFHNFSALNMPEHHPARDMQDTFFVDDKTVLRTHTSNVQIHLMEQNDPPLRYIVPGRVYRNEAIGYKSYCLFHQIEGIYINKKVSLAELKGCLEYFVKQMFGLKIKTRFRPSFFPFTEPSAEVDIWDNKRQQWMEILGCGMVDPAVLKNVDYDTEIWNGYAFGMGVERISMLKYGIDDIRHFYSGDIRFSKQFI